MKASRRAEIVRFINNGDYNLNIKLEQFDELLRLLDEFDNRNKTKEVAVKEAKKTIEERKRIFADLILPYVNKTTANGLFTRDDAREFYSYWTEHSPGQRKMLFERRETFDVGRRIGTWMSNKLKFAKKDDTRESIDAIYQNILNFDGSNDDLIKTHTNNEHNRSRNNLIG